MLEALFSSFSLPMSPRSLVGRAVLNDAQTPEASNHRRCSYTV